MNPLTTAICGICTVALQMAVSQWRLAKFFIVLQPPDPSGIAFKPKGVMEHPRASFNLRTFTWTACRQDVYSIGRIKTYNLHTCYTHHVDIIDQIILLHWLMPCKLLQTKERWFHQHRDRGQTIFWSRIWFQSTWVAQGISCNLRVNSLLLIEKHNVRGGQNQKGSQFAKAS